MAKVREVLVEIITEVCHPDPVDLTNHGRPLFECGLDSVDFASVLMAIEDRFKVSVDSADLDKLGSIDGMTAFVEERQGAA